MSKIIYEGLPPAPQAQETPKSELRPPVSYHARAAILIGMFVFTAILVPGLVFELSWLSVLKVAAVLGVLSAAAFGVLYTWIATTHDWRMDAKERRRRWIAEDEARYSYAPEPEQETEITQSRRLEIVCWKILRLHFVKKLQATRPQCERVGITQHEWNAANRLMQLVGLKGERGWNDDLSAVNAFDRFEEYTRFDQDAVYYSPTGNAANLIRFFAENTETGT